MRPLALLLAAVASLALTSSAGGAESVNVYSIWPENWAKPMFDEFEKAIVAEAEFFGRFAAR